MMRRHPHRTAYTRAEWLSDAIVHVAGLSVVLMAVPVLIVLTAVFRGDAISVMAVSVYAAALVAMIGCSALYNIAEGFAWGSTRTWLLRRLDHSAIYIKIAGTYTPLTLLSGHGMVLTASLWAAAAAGVALKIASPERFRWAALGLYLAMGWAGALAGPDVLAAMPSTVLTLILIGGGLYTLGVVFFLWTRLPYHLTIWHIIVLAATLVFYAAVLIYVLEPA